MNVKKKGILKGFKYFSQIFDEEESKEIQIGLPTDVKHVAHIGWDGPSANAPSWMDDFKQTNGGYQSAPLDGSGSREEEVREERGHKSHASNPTAIDTIAREKDMPTLPKASRRHQSMDSIGMIESPPGSPTGTHQVIKQKDKDKDSKNAGGRRRKEKSSKPKEASATTTSAPNDEASSQSAPSIPKKSRRKKSKDPDASTKSSAKSRQSKNGSIVGSEDGSTKSNSGMAALEEE